MRVQTENDRIRLRVLLALEIYHYSAPFRTLWFENGHEEHFIAFLAIPENCERDIDVNDEAAMHALAVEVLQHPLPALQFAAE